jgi:hypothetical protein
MMWNLRTSSGPLGADACPHITSLTSLKYLQSLLFQRTFLSPPPARRRGPPRGADLVITRSAASSSSGRTKQIYKCSGCGETTLQWSGQCKSCGEWNSLQKVAVAPTGDSGGGGSGARAAARFKAALSSTEDTMGPPETLALRRRVWVQDVEGERRFL